jgi:hypothetical protein
MLLEVRCVMKKWSATHLQPIHPGALLPVFQLAMQKLKMLPPELTPALFGQSFACFVFGGANWACAKTKLGLCQALLVCTCGHHTCACNDH